MTDDYREMLETLAAAGHDMSATLKNLETAAVETEAEAVARKYPKRAREIAALMAGIAPVIRDYVAEAKAPLEARIHELEAKVAQLETDRVAYKGTWKAGWYGKGSLCTHGGGMWLTTREIDDSRPPGHCDGWKLVVKRGQAPE